MLPRADFPESVRRSAAAILQQLPSAPRLAIVLGSGLGEIADTWPTISSTPYRDIPGIAEAGVAGHAGRAVGVEIGGSVAIVLQGRMHYYETGSLAEISHFVRSLCACGIEAILLTNAAGAVNPSYRPGDLMIVRDHICWPALSGANPLVGPNRGPGPRFLTTANLYDPQLYVWAGEAAAGVGATVHSGVYCQVSGPTYETPAEVVALGVLGADAVGMSTAVEAIVAHHCGARILALSTITNIAGSADTQDEHAEVMAAAAGAATAVGDILNSVATRLVADG